MRARLSAMLLAFVLVAACAGIEYLSPQTQAVLAPADAAEVTLPVVMYHHISESSVRLGDYVIAPEQFEADLQFLSEHGYQTATPEEVVAFVESGTPLPEKCVMLTFDDGHESTYVYAFPLLKKYGMTAVVSILGSQTERYSDPNEPRHLNYSYANWEQLREMEDSGVFTIGNHTMDLHDDGTNSARKGICICSGEDEEEYRQAIAADLTALNERMEEELGERPDVFAYPFGALCKESKPLLHELGFNVILTCEEKVNEIAADQALPVVLRRFNRAHRYSSAAFFKRLGIS